MQINVSSPLVPVDKNICIRLLNFLLSKRNYQDNLNGLVLDVYEKEYGNFKKKILNSISYLNSAGLISEYKNNQGKILYKLAKSEMEVLHFIEEKLT